jgi:rubrerythrin
MTEIMEDKIAKRISDLFKPALKKIEKQSKCQHIWKDKNGSANFRCKKCGYAVSDLKLDKLIHEMKLIEKGVTPEFIKKYKKYI